MISFIRITDNISKSTWGISPKLGSKCSSIRTYGTIYLKGGIRYKYNRVILEGSLIQIFNHKVIKFVYKCLQLRSRHETLEDREKIIKDILE